LAVDLLFEPLAELADHVHRGELSARELVEASLERISALDPSLNAFVETDAAGALAAAGAIGPDDPRPFAGVPIAVKANTPVRGLVQSLGSALLADHRAGHDAYLVARLRRAGFVIVGMTNLPEFGILPTTEPRHSGATRNPFCLDRTPGGSSGGSAAAVAAGMVPVAHANDGGGSTRIPAACCGLVGLKGSRGRVSRGPDMGDAFLVVDGALTRTVSDAAAMLDVLSGYEVGDATWAPVDPECERAVREAAEHFAALGHEVTETTPVSLSPELLGLFTALFGPAISLGIVWGERLAGRAATQEEIEPLSRALKEVSDGISSVEYLLALTRLQAVAREIVASFADHDLLLTPALAERPLRIGECTGTGADPMADFVRSGRFTPYTALFNVTGQPAITLPVRWGEDGLPTSVQLAARPLGEDTLLQAAAQLEAAVAVPIRRPIEPSGYDRRR